MPFSLGVHLGLPAVAGDAVYREQRLSELVRPGEFVLFSTLVVSVHSLRSGNLL